MKYRDIAPAFGQESPAEKMAPLRKVTIEPGDFADTWSGKPAKPIVAGLRLLSSDDEETIREQSAKNSAQQDSEELEDIVDAFNSSMRAQAVALALCDPNDVTRPHPSFPMAEDSVPEALTSKCITRIFDEVERLHVETSPLFSEATDDEIRLLIGALAIDEPLVGVPPAQARRIRRYLHFVLTEVIELGEDPEEQD